ncbi:MAG: sigma 54-interacting transcriptional regulator [Candidatus Riflebacteria bacterium]|nr:sigma 54-interacting transcriptional regulator [Candidatus Riflebacteria bacterium]
MPFLLHIVARAIVQEYRFDRFPILIGRLPESQIVIRDGQVSRRHARIVSEATGFFVEDLNSTNFVFVNGQRVARGPLDHGDVLNVAGVADFLFLTRKDADLTAQVLANMPAVPPPQESAPPPQPPSPPAAAAAPVAPQVAMPAPPVTSRILLQAIREAISPADGTPVVVPIAPAAPVQEPRAAPRSPAAGSPVTAAVGATLEDLQALHETGTMLLGRPEELEHGLQALVDRAISLLRARRGFLLVRSTRIGAAGDWQVRVARTADGCDLDGETQQSYVRELIDRVVAVEETTTSRQLEGDAGPGAQRSLSRVLQEAIGSPLKVADWILGVLYCDGCRNEVGFTQRTMLLFEILARWASQALERQRLASQLAEQHQRFLKTAEQLKVSNRKLREAQARLEELEPEEPADSVLGPARTERPMPVTPFGVRPAPESMEPLVPAEPEELLDPFSLSGPDALDAIPAAPPLPGAPPAPGVWEGDISHAGALARRHEDSLDPAAFSGPEPVLQLSDSDEPELRLSGESLASIPIRPPRLPAIEAGYRPPLAGPAGPGAGGPASIPGLVGASPESVELFAKARQVARFFDVLLITGEPGTGKKTLAAAIHGLSDRAKRPFVHFDASACRPEECEQRLFGWVEQRARGGTHHQGYVDRSAAGILLVEDVEGLTLSAQQRLDHLLAHHKFARLGSDDELPADVKVIVTTSRDLEELVLQGAFDRDLYYSRIRAVHLHLRPLLERPADVAAMAQMWLSHFNRKFQKTLRAVSAPALALLQRFPWRGNVTELRSTLEAAVMVGTHRDLEISDLPPALQEFHRRNPEPRRGR